MSSLDILHGIYQPEDILIVRNAVMRVSAEPWFTSDLERRAEFARYVLRVYSHGLVLAEPLEALCRVAAMARFSNRAQAFSVIKGRRILVVEDEYWTAAEAAGRLKELGAEVSGPVGTLCEAMDLVERSDSKLDAALLDINLNGRMTYPVAAFLRMRSIPFAFITGYDDRHIPAFYRSTLTVTKPVDWGLIASRLLSEHLER